jgi:hypothetical protein
MVVAMIAVRMVQVSVHQIVDMVAVRDRLVSAAGAMLMGALYIRRAAGGIGRVDSDDMLVDVIAMHVVQMAVMQVVDVPVMADSDVTAAWAVLMGVVGMVLLVASGHGALLLWVIPPGWASLSLGGVIDGTLHQLQDMKIGQRVEDVLGRAAPFHQPHGMQGLETGGDRAQLLVLQFRQLGHADFALGGGEPRQQPQPRRIAERPEHVRGTFEPGSGGQ